LPILLVTFMSFLLGRGDEIGRLAILGILLVAAGCFLLPMRRFGGWRLRNYMNAGCALALLAAVGTTGYTIIDDLALAELRAPPARLFGPMEAAFLYQGLQAFSTMLWQGLGMLLVRDAPGDRGSAAFARQWKSALIAGVGIYLAYGLALTAMAYVSDVSYVAAFRQLSIPIGAAAGILLLKEPCYGPRVVGVITILAGLLLVGLG
jgi:drug/metabolite transporter (DMT)-like permease